MDSQKISYEDSLRAIGQGLEKLGAVAFELEHSEGAFIVSCEYRKTAASKPIQRKSFLRLIQNIVAKPTTEPTLLSNISGLRLAGSDIADLERKGRAFRASSGDRTPDPHSLSHMLRMTGAYLDSGKSGLSKCSWRSPTLTLWEIRAGKTTRKEFTLLEMYDFWVHQFKKRMPGAA